MNLSKFSVHILLWVTVVSSPPAFAHAQSNAASVTLVATVQESLAVNHVFVSVALPFLQDKAAVPAILLILLQWRLRNGRGLWTEPTLVAEDHEERLSSPSGFFTLRQLAGPSPLFSFCPSSKKRMIMLGALTDSAEEPAGRASLWIGIDVVKAS